MTAGRAEVAAQLSDVLEDHRRVLGDEHPYTLGVRYQLALAVAAQGRLAEARSGLRALLDVQRRVLGAAHRYVQNTERALADDMKGPEHVIAG